MRVLHVTGCCLPATEWGGVVTAVAGLVRASAAARIECEIFTTTQRSSRALPPVAPGTRLLDGVRATWFRSIHAAGRGFVAPAMLPALRRHAREFDLVHIHMLWTFPGIAAGHVCRAQGIPYVVSPHGAFDPHALTQRATEKKLFLLAGERRSVRRAAMLQFSTEEERAAAPAWVRERPAAVVPNVVETTVERPPRTPGREILLLGRIHPIKGFDVLIPAMRRVIAAVPDASLVIAGPDEGGYRAQVEALIAANGLQASVRFAGHVSATERDGLLRGVALLAAPSYQENFGMAVAEAMAAGVPVVVSDKVNLACEVAAGGAGLVTRLDPEELAAAIIALLRDPARGEAMGLAGRRMAQERFSPAAAGAKLRAAYESIIRRA